MRRSILLLLALSLVSVLVGCSPYVGDYQYYPRPALAEIPSTQPQAEPPPLSVLASIVGVRYEDRGANLPSSVEVRLQVENNSEQPAIFEAGSLALINGELLTFGPPILFPPATRIQLQPMQQMTMTAFFPFPPGRSYVNTDLNSFQLQWTATVEGRRVKQVVYFRRIAPVYYRPYDPYYYGPYYGPAVGFSTGVVIVHRR